MRDHVGEKEREKRSHAFTAISKEDTYVLFFFCWNPVVTAVVVFFFFVFFVYFFLSHQRVERNHQQSLGSTLLRLHQARSQCSGRVKELSMPRPTRRKKDGTRGINCRWQHTFTPVKRKREHGVVRERKTQTHILHGDMYTCLRIGIFTTKKKKEEPV